MVPRVYLHFGHRDAQVRADLVTRGRRICGPAGVDQVVDQPLDLGSGQLSGSTGGSAPRRTGLPITAISPTLIPARRHASGSRYPALAGHFGARSNRRLQRRITPMPGIAVRTCSSFLCRQVRAIGNADHAGVDRAADADLRPVVDAHPGRPAAVFTIAFRSGQSAIASERRPSIRFHGRGSDRTGVEVIAADHDRTPDLAGPDHLAEPQAEPVTLLRIRPSRSVTAGPGRRSACRPAGSSGPAIVAGQLLQTARSVAGDVGRVAGERGPAEGAPASQNIGRM